MLAARIALRAGEGMGAGTLDDACLGVMLCLHKVSFSGRSCGIRFSDDDLATAQVAGKLIVDTANNFEARRQSLAVPRGTGPRR